MIVGMTSGCFDLIHFGHVLYLERCKDLCDKLIVGIDSDEMVEKAKGKGRPIIPDLERWAMVNNLHPVDAAFIMYDLIDLYRMSIHFQVNKVFKHEGFAKLNTRHRIFGVYDTKAELVIVPDIPGLVSTSNIIQRIKEEK